MVFYRRVASATSRGAELTSASTGLFSDLSTGGGTKRRGRVVAGLALPFEELF